MTKKEIEAKAQKLAKLWKTYDLKPTTRFECRNGQACLVGVLACDNTKKDITDWDDWKDVRGLKTNRLMEAGFMNEEWWALDSKATPERLTEEVRLKIQRSSSFKIGRRVAELVLPSDD